MLVALAGIGVFTYILTNITAIIVEGEILKTYKKNRVLKMISKLENHYIICGATGVSLQIAKELASTKRAFVFIDKEEHHIGSRSSGEYLFVKGDPTDEKILELAAVKKATGLFATTNDDNINLVITFTSRHLNKGLRIISKCNHPKNADKIKKAGADSVVSPNTIGGLRIVSEMIRPKVVTFLDTMLRDREKSLRVEEIHLGADYDGKIVKDLDLRNSSKALLLAIKEDEKWVFNPPDDHKLKKGDELIFMVTPEEREILKERFSN
jgi:voltage-gated potassium channel